MDSNVSLFPLAQPLLGSGLNPDSGLSLLNASAPANPSQTRFRGSHTLSWQTTAVEEILTRFAKSKKFFQILGTAFGDSFSVKKAQGLRQQWSIGNFSGLPDIQIRTAADLNGALSAFATDTNTIYVSRKTLKQTASARDIVTGLLLEEFGHFVDAKINKFDAPGDEGAIFAALVQGVNLNQTTLQTLKAEDDNAIIRLNGKMLQIEQATSEIGNGLRGEYYDNANLTNLKVTRTDSTVNFDWGSGSPDTAIAPNTFSARWTGQVQPLTSGTYTFFTQSDDGIRLWVNGRRIINNWTNHTVTENRGTITLTAGQKYDIKLEYYDNNNSAVAKLLWSAPGVTKRVIPQSQLFSQPIDVTPPTANLTATHLTTASAAPYQFTVTYSDTTAMNIATLNGSDILVAGPNGFNQMAALVSVDNTANGTPRTATYQISPPNGSWDAVDNGIYSFLLQPNQVSDTSGNFIPARTLGSFLVSLDPGNNHGNNGENIVFPTDAGVLNVKDFGARGDGITDDTAAIQAALNAYPNGSRIIYLPNGVYLVSNTLTWPAGTPGNEYKRTILQGQSESGAIIQLRNSATGFTNPNAPRSVIFTGPAPAQRFGNSIRNLTVDTGVGNLGAVGIQFNASNQGSMRQVTIQSGDGHGVNGLDMDFTDEIGPLLVKGVTVKGFQYGIVTGYTVNSQTFEDIHLENQSVYGFWNYSQVVNIRNLTSNNTVTAIYNGVGNTSHMTLIDSSLTGLGNAVSQPAIINGGTLLARSVATSGYGLAIDSGSNDVTGPNISEFVSSPVVSQFPSPLQTLNLPIRETPEVPWDDPITTPWANVVSYGAIPNDGLDDTVAIQSAIDSGKTTVYFPVGRYNLASTIFVRGNIRRLIGTEAYVEVPNTVNPGFKVLEGTHPVVVFERIHSGFEPTPTLENASSRTLVIRDATNVSGNMTGSGDVFIENVVSNPFSSWTFNGQNVWARQFNVENTGTHITNNGGNLWILGLKTERGGTLIDTRGSGKTEVLGGLAYTTTAGPDGTQNYPMFISHESSISISLAEVKYSSDDPNYITYVQETRGGVTRNLSANGLPNYWGSGRDIPLYVGYQN